MIAAFDLDGTLADTRPLVKRAYELAGVHYPEYLAWGADWRSWLPALVKHPERVHAVKNDIYLKLLRDEPPAPLPAYGLLVALRHTSRLAVVTSASLQAAHAVMDALDLRHDLLRLTSATKHTRLEWLKWNRAEDELGVYVDDRDDGLDLADSVGWCPVRADDTDAMRGVLKCAP